MKDTEKALRWYCSRIGKRIPELDIHDKHCVSMMYEYAKKQTEQDKFRKRLEQSDQFLRAFARSEVFDAEATENLWKCIELNEEVLNQNKMSNG